MLVLGRAFASTTTTTTTTTRAFGAFQTHQTPLLILSYIDVFASSLAS